VTTRYCWLLFGAVCSALSGCGHLYRATSSSPALVQVPRVAHGADFLGLGVADSFDLVAVDGQTMGMPMTDKDFRRIDPGIRRLALIYHGNKRVLAELYTSVPLVLNARLEAGHRYRVVCESSDVAVKGYVRDLGTNQVVSNVAEGPLLTQPQSGTTVVPIVVPRR
jgi:hypothetical protein